MIRLEHTEQSVSPDLSPGKRAQIKRWQEIETAAQVYMETWQRAGHTPEVVIAQGALFSLLRGDRRS